jgi:hypothetical protein
MIERAGTEHGPSGTLARPPDERSVDSDIPELGVLRAEDDVDERFEQLHDLVAGK